MDLCGASGLQKGPTVGEGAPICGDIFKLHRKLITKDLRLINITEKKYFNLDEALPIYWCRECRRHKISMVPEKSFEEQPGSSSGKCLPAPKSHVQECEVSCDGDEATICFDPWKMHRKTVTKDLRPVGSTDLKLLNFDGTVKRFWCSSCRKKMNEINLAKPTSFFESNSNVEGITEHITVSAEKTNLMDEGTAEEIAEGIAASVLQYSGLIPGTSYDSCHSPVISSSKEHLKEGTMHCDFADDPEICAGKMILFDGLIKDERDALIFQTGQDENRTSKRESRTSSDDMKPKAVCDAHYQILVGQFKAGEPTFTESCCDPMGVHFKKVENLLRTVGVNYLIKAKEHNVTLVYGDKICKNCINRVTSNPGKEVKEELTEGQNSDTSCSSFLSPSVRKESAIKYLDKVGLTCLKSNTRTLAGRISYGKRKLAEGTEILKKKLCLVLDLPQGSLEESKSQESIDMDLLLEEIKAELPNANKVRRYQLLSLVPLSISTNEACNMFGISKTLFNKAREIRIVHGILPNLQFSRQSSVLDSTKKLALEFYLDDENSKVFPGKKDCISVSKCIYEQKRLMLCNVQELYACFEKENPDLKVGLSLFYKLKPKWCVFPGGSGTHTVCCCQIHEDARLIAHALGIKKYYRQIISHLVCNEESETCMLRLCKNCFTIPQIMNCLHIMSLNDRHNGSDSLQDNFSQEELDEILEEKIEYYQWRTKDGQTELVTLIGKFSEVLEVAAKQFNTLIPHEFIAKRQAEYVKNLRCSLPRNKVVILMDFAMNYTCLFPKEIQSYHWTKKQVTMHPVVIYYKPDEESEEKHLSLCFISDDLTHDVPMVRVFQKKVIAFVKEKFPQVTEVEYVTDGCGSQYKNKMSFWNLCHHKKEYEIKATHSFFATSHGKSMCDALSGILKRLVGATSLQSSVDSIINSAIKVYDFFKNHTISNKVKFEYVDKAEVDHERNEMIDANLLEAVPGTSSFHYYEPLSETSVGCKRVSGNSLFMLTHCLQKPEKNQVLTFSPGSYVIVRIAGRRFVGFLSDINHEEGEADVSLLRPHLPTETLSWPEDLNTRAVPLPHVLCSVTLKDLPDNKFTFTKEDKDLLLRMKIVRGKKK